MKWSSRRALSALHILRLRKAVFLASPGHLHSCGASAVMDRACEIIPRFGSCGPSGAGAVALVHQARFSSLVDLVAWDKPYHDGSSSSSSSSRLAPML